jgi:LPS-assembly lipoprotein
VIRRSFLVLACATLTLSACGFELRGQHDFPFKRLAIVGAPAPVAARITRLVEAGSDTVVVNSPTNADAILHVTEGRGLSALTLSALGVVEEYQVNYTLTYTLLGADGRILLRPSAIALNRAMTYNDQFAQAKVAEADLLWTDMQNDAADQLLRRLAAVRTLTPAPGQEVPGIAPGAPLPPPPL